MISVLDYGGLPLTADRVVHGVVGTAPAAGQRPHVAPPSLARGAAV
jgi:hypothetical protein